MAYKILLGVVAALMILNAGLLFDTQRTRWATVKAAEEAAKPAEVSFTLIKPKDCKECFDAAAALGQLQENPGVKVKEQKIVTLGEDTANTLIAQYAITRLPAVVVQGDTEKLLLKIPSLSQAGSSVPSGTELKDKTLVMTKFPPPYFDLTSKAVKGLLKVTYITVSSCKDCYDVQLHKLALGNLGITASNEVTVSQSSDAGQKLIARYGIQKLPTVVLTGDMAEYPILKQIWSSVGSIAKDGAYVFTALESMGTYKDLKTGKIVKPKTNNQ